MCVIVKNMLCLGTNILHFRERNYMSNIKIRYLQRIWRIMLFLYLYQLNIIQFRTSMRHVYERLYKLLTPLRMHTGR